MKAGVRDSIKNIHTKIITAVRNDFQRKHTTSKKQDRFVNINHKEGVWVIRVFEVTIHQQHNTNE